VQAAKGIVVPEHALDTAAAGRAPDQSGPRPRDVLALPLPPPARPPPALLAAQGEAASLWEEVNGHLRRFEDLPGLVEGVVGSDTHPYAIDGAKLRALAGLGDGAAPATAGATPGGAAAGGGAAAAELDIVAMLEGWVDRLEALEPHIADLDGTGLAGAPPTPLLATADARSHAPHLFAQLGVHRVCLQGMRELECAIEEELATTGACTRAPPWTCGTPPHASC
jgi:hypothetical protein